MQEKKQKGDFWESQAKTRVETRDFQVNLSNFWMITLTSNPSKKFSRGLGWMFEVSKGYSKVISF